MKFLQYLSLRLSSVVIILLSLTVAVLSVIVFYSVVPKMNPVLGRDKIETAVIDTLNNAPEVDVVLYVQVNLETNSRKFVTGALRDSGDKPLLDLFEKYANNTKFISAGNAEFVRNLIANNVACQNKATLNPAVVSIIKSQLAALENFSTCSIPVVNNSRALVGYVAIIWKNSPGSEKELLTLMKLQTEIAAIK